MPDSIEPITAVNTSSFEEFLVAQGFITKALFDNLKEQASKSGQSVLDLIVAQKILNSKMLAQAKGAFLNVPYIDLQEIKVDSEVLQAIPKETIEFYQVVPFAKEGNNLKVAVTDPTNLQALEALSFFSKKAGLNIQLYVTDEVGFSAMFSQIQNIHQVVGEALESIHQKEQEDEKKKQQQHQESEQPLQQLIQDAPVSKIVDVILTKAINSNASDIHIEPEANFLRVRYRIDGILQTVLQMPSDIEPAIASKIKILSNLKIDESRLPQDGRFHYETSTRSVDLRVSILPNVNGEKIVMRILDKTVKAPTLEQLGFRGKALQWVNENIHKTHGIFLITGPTGSGKSTTLYSILTMLNDVKVNIITLEDPVEYFMDGVNQSQINDDIGLTFASGLRSILRQDPNIIMVGEIRDKETAELAVQAALTGHMVFSTLHTNSAIGALPRLLDMGIEPFLMTASINAVGAQRLTRKVCQDCKHEVPLEDPIRDKIREKLANVSKEELEGISLDDLHIYEGAGCDKCGGTGYKGRIAIVEVLVVTPKIQDMVLTGKNINDMLAEAQSMGMITMEQDGLIKVLKGLTSYAEILRVTSE